MAKTYPILKRGDTGSSVEALQKQLANWWGIPCSVDGVFGYNTEAAVKQFQAMRQTNHEYAGKPLAQDGVVGRATWAELTKVKFEDIAIAVHIVGKDQLTYVFERTPTDAQVNDINSALKRFDIITPVRIRHFLAQCAHESGGLKWMKELASGDAYEGRQDLGNTQRGDGRKFKGAGMIQTTGRANYQKLADYLGDRKVIEIGCDYVAEHYPATAAAFWWHNNKMNSLCDRGASVAEVSKRVNGKHPANGLKDREKYYDRACKVI